MTGREKVLAAAFVAAAGMSGMGSTSAWGQVAYTTPGGAYSQNFDSLQASGTAGTQVTWQDNVTLPGWYGALGTTSAPATIYRVSDGSVNSGSLYSFGTLAADPANGDRALGSIGSGSTGPTGGPNGIYYGVALTNNTGQTLSTFNLSYIGELWRATGTTTLASTIANTLQFSYSTTAANIYAASGYTPVTALDFKAPAAGSPPGYTAQDGAVNGNSAAYQSAISGSVSIAGGWAPNATLWLRWLDVNDAGNDQGLALDNLSFSAMPHVAVHNGTTLTVGGSKTAPVQDLGRVVAGTVTASKTVNLGNSGPVSTTYADVSSDGSVVTPTTGSVAAGGTTPVSVKISAGAIPTPPSSGFTGYDFTSQALVQNTGEDNDANVAIPLKVHVVQNRFVDNFDTNTFTGGSAAPVDFGKMLVGATKTVPGVMLTTTNTAADFSTNTLTAVTLPAASVSGFAGGATSGYATVTMAAGTNGDVLFADGNAADTRDVTLTAVQSGIVKPSAGGGERSVGFLSVPIIQSDTAAGASGDARVYVSGDFYAPAAPTGPTTAVVPGGSFTLTNSAPTGDGAAGKRLGADILGTSFNQSGWSVSGLPTSIGAARAQYTTGSPAVTVPAVISSATGTIAFDPAGKLNGTYGATLSIQLQNDQTQGVYGVAPHDLPDTTVPVTAAVTDKPANQSGSYSLNGGTLSAGATTLSGSFTQSGGASTFASVIGGGTVAVTGGSMTLSPGATTNVVKALSISGTGKVDVTSSKLVMDYPVGLPSSPLPAIRAALQAGSANGWTGATGLTSSDAAAHTAASYALGYADASKALGLSGSATATWNGATVDATSMLLKETYYGDANLDGKVDADDLARLDAGAAKHLTAGLAVWTDGDFNYDGSVTSADYLLADTAFGQHGGTLSPEFLATREAEFGSAYVAELVAAVPEPTGLGLVGVIGAGLLGRRRRIAK